MRSRETPYRLVELDGTLAAVHVRIDNPDGTKSFRWELADGTLGLQGRPTSRLPLYGLERRPSWAPNTPIHLTEGEAAADALAGLDIPVLATVTGANGTPDVAVLEVLRGTEVRLWADNDQVGRGHMDRIAERLSGIARSVAFIDWPEAPEGGDAVDFVKAGGIRGDVLNLPIRPAHPREGGWAESIPSSEIDSAQPLPPRRAQRRLAFRTAAELARSGTSDLTWIAPYVPAGAITLVEGKIKAAGKTTFLTHLCRAVLDGRPFLGQPTRQTGVVYLTEQPDSSFREAVRRADLLDRADFTFLSWRDTFGLAWPAIVEATVDECDRRGAGLLVIDTLGRFTGMAGDGENSAGAAEAAMAPLQAAAADGLAIIPVRHERKAGGDPADAGRGSSAFGGAADVILSIRRPDGSGSPSVRVLQGLSRFDEIPELQYVELTDAGYQLLGDNAAFARHEAEGRILEHLASDPGAAYREADLVVATGSARSTVQRVLTDLVARGSVARLGGGRKGDPHRYQLASVAPEASAQSSGVATLAELFRQTGGDLDAIAALDA